MFHSDTEVKSHTLMIKDLLDVVNGFILQILVNVVSSRSK